MTSKLLIEGWCLEGYNKTLPIIRNRGACKSKCFLVTYFFSLIFMCEINKNNFKRGLYNIIIIIVIVNNRPSLLLKK